MKSFWKTLALLLAVAPVLAQASDPWTSATTGTRHTLTHTAKAGLPGVSTPVTVVFACDPVSDAESSGTLGFDLTVKNPEAVKGFPFSDFEGPDAVAAPRVEVVVRRGEQPAQTFRTTASGSFSDPDAFCFTVAEVSKKSKSVPRSILQALANSETESVEITIADPRDAKNRLVITVPTAGKQKAFQALLAGLK